MDKKIAKRIDEINDLIKMYELRLPLSSDDIYSKGIEDKIKSLKELRKISEDMLYGDRDGQMVQ